MLAGSRIRIGDKFYRYHKSRDLKGVIKTLTVKRDALGDIYLVFSCDGVLPDVRERAMTGKSAGADFGLRTYLTLSDGEQKQSPQAFKRGLRSIKRASRALSRKKKGSHNRSRARKDFARAHKKAADQRLDFSMKLAREMAITYDHLFFEDLNIEAMKRLWGRKVSDMGFAAYLKMQGHMCSRFGSVMETVDPFYPSSKTCHICGHVNETLKLHDRNWTCPSCNALHDRDKNASIVIHMVGASDHWERSSKTSVKDGSNSAYIPESHML